MTQVLEKVIGSTIIEEYISSYNNTRYNSTANINFSDKFFETLRLRIKTNGIFSTLRKNSFGNIKKILDGCQNVIIEIDLMKLTKMKSRTFYRHILFMKQIGLIRSLSLSRQYNNYGMRQRVMVLQALFSLSEERVLQRNKNFYPNSMYMTLEPYKKCNKTKEVDKIHEAMITIDNRINTVVDKLDLCSVELYWLLKKPLNKINLKKIKIDNVLDEINSMKEEEKWEIEESGFCELDIRDTHDYIDKLVRLYDQLVIKETNYDKSRSVIRI